MVEKRAAKAEKYLALAANCPFPKKKARLEADAARLLANAQKADDRAWQLMPPALQLLLDNDDAPAAP